MPGPRTYLTAAALTGCVQDTETHCVQRTEFIKTISINGTDSVLLVNQRCCLANDIANLNKSINQGFTLTLKLPPSTQPNNSAIFKDAPPIRFCMNTNFEVDHSATDADGDSLYYRFVPALNGGNNNDAKPVGQAPPYDTVDYKSPATYLMPMAGAGSLYLNVFTGKLSGICARPGDYMINIACDEYRNNRLINTVVRSYTYEIAECQRGATALVNVDSAVLLAGNVDSLIAVQCNGRTVQFKNSSTGATTYSWDFGDGSTTADVSTDASPAYTYPATGSYKVRLIAYGLSCNDTLYGIVQIGDDLVNADFEVGNILCTGNPVQLTDASIITKGTIVKQIWTANGQVTYLDPAAIYLQQAGTYAITHYVTTAQGCISAITKNISIRNADIYTGNDTAVVVGTQLQLHASGGTNYNWISFGAALNANNIPDPVAVFTLSGYNIYTVQGTDNGGCEGVDTMHVTVTDKAYVVVPTGFTPNNDGHNDVLRPLLSGGVFEEFRLYNRLGQQVYATTDPKAGWDGTFKGKEQDAGAYFWMVKMKDAPGIKRVNKGEATLVR